MNSSLDLEAQSEKVANILKLLAHPKRLLILCKLSLGDKTVGELEKDCTISQSQLSQFLKKMSDEWLVEWQKNGLHVSYRIKDKQIQELLRALSSIYCETDCSPTK